MSNTITIELCKEDRQRLDDITGFLGWIVSELKSHPVVATAPQETPEPSAPEILHPADILPPHGEPEPVAPVEAPEPELPKYTKEDIQAKVQSMAGPGNPKREQAKAIVQSYGKKVSDIPEDKRTEAMLRLIELEQAPLEG